MRARLVLLIAIAGCGSAPDPRAAASICSAVTFSDKAMVSATGFNRGDSWMMSWAKNGATITNFSDGNLTPDGPKYPNAILTIDGTPPALAASAFHDVAADPLGVQTSWPYYMVSTLVVDDTLYVGLIDFFGNGGIARSPDLGMTFDFDRQTPMWSGSAGKRFAYPSFLQNGRGYDGNRDGYVYVYATDGDWGGNNAIRLARVPSHGDLLSPASYRYWDGDGWSRHLDHAVDLFPGSSDHGGMQSIVYNPILDRYFLITFGEPHGEQARMILYDAAAPTGPWWACGEIQKAEAVFGDAALQTAIYNPSFNAKWIEPDGAMWISYSSCCDLPQYDFSYGRIRITPTAPLK